MRYRRTARHGADAAILYLRAGGSALMQGDGEAAGTLLEKADQFARQPGAGDVVVEIDRVKRAGTQKGGS